MHEVIRAGEDPKKLTQIPEEMRIMEKQIEELGMNLDALRNRLEPVLSFQGKVPAQASGSDKAGICPLGDHLHRLNELLRYSINFVSDVNNRLEI